MRLGSIIYFIPFFFVFDPAFIWQGPVERTAFLFAQATVGILFVAGALQGYLLFIGKVSDGPIGLLARLALAVGGIALAMPGNDVITMSNAELALCAAVLIAIGIGVGLVDKRSQAVPEGAD